MGTRGTRPSAGIRLNPTRLLPHAGFGAASLLKKACRLKVGSTLGSGAELAELFRREQPRERGAARIAEMTDF